MTRPKRYVCHIQVKFFYAFNCLLRFASCKEVKYIDSKFIGKWVSKVRKADKDSCETVIEGLENLLKSSESNSALFDGASELQYSTF